MLLFLFAAVFVELKACVCVCVGVGGWVGWGPLVMSVLDNLAFKRHH
jgi:hypothetical protein